MRESGGVHFPKQVMASRWAHIVINLNDWWGQACDFAILSLICHTCTANDLGLRLTRNRKVASLTLGY